MLLSNELAKVLEKGTRQRLTFSEKEEKGKKKSKDKPKRSNSITLSEHKSCGIFSLFCRVIKIQVEAFVLTFFVTSARKSFEAYTHTRFYSFPLL